MPRALCGLRCRPGKRSNPVPDPRGDAFDPDDLDYDTGGLPEAINAGIELEECAMIRGQTEDEAIVLGFADP